MLVTTHLKRFWLFVVVCLCLATQTSSASFDKDGLAFDYAPDWELSDQSNGAAQQLVLTEKKLDSQIMIIALRGTIDSSQQEEQSKTALIEPSIRRLLKQYDDVGIKVERSEITGVVAGVATEGAQLRFAVDGQPAITEIHWLIINKRLVQLFFIRPEKTAAQSGSCWDMIRNSLKIKNAAAK